MKVTSAKNQPCSICGINYRGFGNNAWPVNKGRCCDTCNTLHVIPQRIADMTAAHKAREANTK